MLRQVLTCALAVSLAGAPQALLAQAGTDPEVVKGIKQVDDGDYDSAILTLDNAARRLAQDPAKARELSQAYLYLGIAYVGKGHEAAAKAKFREALAQIKDLTLSPDQFPPKVIDVFEAAKEEAAQQAPAAPAAAQPPKKKGGSKGLLIGLGVVAVGGGVAAAAGGGGSSTPTTTLPQDTRHTFNASGTLPNGGHTYQCYQIVATTAGTLEARLSWTNGQIEMGMTCQEHEPPYTACTGVSNRTTNTTAVLTTPVTQKTYDICPYNNSGTTDTYTLTILFP